MASLGPRSVIVNESTDGRRVDVINEGGWLNGVHEIGNWVATMCRWSASCSGWSIWTSVTNNNANDLISECQNTIQVHHRKGGRD